MRKLSRVDYQCTLCQQKFGDPDERIPRITFPAWVKCVLAHVFLHHAHDLDPQKHVNEFIVPTYS